MNYYTLIEPHLLDSYPATKAFSMRKLRKAQTLCVKVRRDSDNTLQDIGFKNNWIDTDALLTFVGGGSGYVHTWYDQSGNGWDYSCTVDLNQPRIVNAGVIETFLGNPTIYFPDDTYLSLVNPSALSYPSGSIYASIFCVVSADLTGPDTYGAIYVANSLANRGRVNLRAVNALNRRLQVAAAPFGQLGGTGVVNCTISEGVTLDDFHHTQFNVIFKISTTIPTTVRNCGVLRESATANGNLAFNTDVLIESYIGGGDPITHGSPLLNSFRGSISELVFYNDDKTSEQDYIDGNQGAAFLAGYNKKFLLDEISTTPAMAWSLRKLRYSSTNCIRVRRSSDNAEQDIGFAYNKVFGGYWVDVQALKTFVGTGSGFVTVWYDQSGNGRDVTQSTAANQPRIMNTGVMETYYGRPAPRAIGGATTMLQSDGDVFSGADGAGFYFIANINVTAASQMYLYRDFTTSGTTRVEVTTAGGSLGVKQWRCSGRDSAGLLRTSDFAASMAQYVDQNTAIVDFDGMDGVYCYTNGVLISNSAAFTSGTSAFPSGTSSASNEFHDGNGTNNQTAVGEMIIFNSKNHLADQQIIERSQMLAWRT